MHVITSSQPPPVDPGTDSSDNWFVELFLEGTVVNSTTTPDAQTTTVTFNMLMKGTLYSVRVRGINEFGIGSFSSFVIVQTAVDRKLVIFMYFFLDRPFALLDLLKIFPHCMCVLVCLVPLHATDSPIMPLPVQTTCYITDRPLCLLPMQTLSTCYVSYGQTLMPLPMQTTCYVMDRPLCLYLCRQPVAKFSSVQ
jgi:hypothetical protein